jgi:hypothetical protein
MYNTSWLVSQQTSHPYPPRLCCCLLPVPPPPSVQSLCYPQSNPESLRTFLEPMDIPEAGRRLHIAIQVGLNLSGLAVRS